MPKILLAQMIAVVNIFSELSNKSALRQHFIYARQRAHAQAAMQSAPALSSIFFNSSQFHQAKTILGYAPMGSEINVAPICQFFAHQKKSRYFLPYYSKKRPDFIDFYEIHLPLLLNNCSSLKEELHNPKQWFSVIEPEHPILCLVPLLAFDAQGNRLGRGKGYYDRAIKTIRKKCSALITLGLAYDEQFHPATLPIQPHDEKLDFILTPTQLWDFSHTTVNSEAPLSLNYKPH